jgi:galactose mutarotase-like enzyme
MATVRSRPVLETLRAGALEASFVPEAGMLGTSLRHDGEELLGPLGIPFLHPWANRLSRDVYAAAGRLVELPPGTPRDEHGLPIHGVAPKPFRVSGRSASSVDAVLDFDDAAFPFPHRVQQRAELSPYALRITTTVRAARCASVPIAFGFHPYFSPPSVARPGWRISLPPRRRLTADDRLIPTGERVAEPFERFSLGERIYDDGYDGLGAGALFALEGGGRRIEVVLDAGYPCAQLFAPPDDDVVCFEPMTAPANALVTGDGLTVLAPGAVYRAGFTIRVLG